MILQADTEGISVNPAEKMIIKENDKMEKYQCPACPYVYDPGEGDPENGIDPGTPFDELPEDWVCPVCGAPKDIFEPEE